VLYPVCLSRLTSSEKEMGVKVAKKELKLGIRASSTCTLNFDDIRVPKENVLGEIGKGYKYAIEILNGL
jgi:short/branched chain acyl-CoA dehydrogenase